MRTLEVGNAQRACARAGRSHALRSWGNCGRSGPLPRPIARYNNIVHDRPPAGTPSVGAAPFGNASRRGRKPLGTQMKLSTGTLLVSALFLFTSCLTKNQYPVDPVTTGPASHYEYRVGLGYGFLGKAVHVTVNGIEVLSIVGTDEIEQFAQLQGTMMLASGSSIEKDIKVRVTVNDSQPYEQAIDLSKGRFIHIYYERTGLHIFNTRFHVLE